MASDQKGAHTDHLGPVSQPGEQSQDTYHAGRPWKAVGVRELTTVVREDLIRAAEQYLTGTEVQTPVK